MCLYWEGRKDGQKSMPAATNMFTHHILVGVALSINVIGAQFRVADGCFHSRVAEILRVRVGRLAAAGLAPDAGIKK